MAIFLKLMEQYLVSSETLCLFFSKIVNEKRGKNSLSCWVVVYFESFINHPVKIQRIFATPPEEGNFVAL